MLMTLFIRSLEFHWPATAETRSGCMAVEGMAFV